MTEVSTVVTFFVDIDTQVMWIDTLDLGHLALEKALVILIDASSCIAESVNFLLFLDKLMNIVLNEFFVLFQPIRAQTSFLSHLNKLFKDSQNVFGLMMQGLCLEVLP